MKGVSFWFYKRPSMQNAKPKTVFLSDDERTITTNWITALYNDNRRELLLLPCQITWRFKQTKTVTTSRNPVAVLNDDL